MRDTSRKCWDPVSHESVWELPLGSHHSAMQCTWSARLAFALLSSSSRTTSRWPFLEAMKRLVSPACAEGTQETLDEI